MRAAAATAAATATTSLRAKEVFWVYRVCIYRRWDGGGGGGVLLARYRLPALPVCVCGRVCVCPCVVCLWGCAICENKEGCEARRLKELSCFAPFERPFPPCGFVHKKAAGVGGIAPNIKSCWTRTKTTTTTKENYNKEKGKQASRKREKERGRHARPRYQQQKTPPSPPQEQHQEDKRSIDSKKQLPNQNRWSRESITARVQKGKAKEEEKHLPYRGPGKCDKLKKLNETRRLKNDELRSAFAFLLCLFY